MGFFRPPNLNQADDPTNQFGDGGYPGQVWNTGPLAPVPGQQTPYNPATDPGLTQVGNQYAFQGNLYDYDPNSASNAGGFGTQMLTPSGQGGNGGGNGGNGGGGDTGGGGGGYGSGGFQFPTFTPPPWQSVNPFVAPAPFSYQDFSAPTIDQARNEPGFAFALDEGQKALQNSAAAKGTLRSGGAEKGLASWTNQFADQNYGNVFNRASQVYNTNRGNAAENYLTNYGISRDVWDRNTGQQNLANNYNFNAAAAAFNPQFQASQLQFADLFNRAQLNQQGQQSNNALLGQLASYGYA